jgi:5-methylcytosine-specific restriction endonuclease McrA
MKAKLPSQADAGLARARRLLHNHRARARLDGQHLDYGLVELRDLLARSLTCAYCRRPLAWDASVDHRTPTSKGGRHAFDNLAVACARCNGLKGSMGESDFRELLTWLVQHPRAAVDLERRLISGGTIYAAKRRSRRGADFGPSGPS